MMAYLYCVVYTRMSHHHPLNRGELHLTMMGRECNSLVYFET